MPSPSILVTGGAGYIGSHVCLALHQAGFTPVAFDNLSAGHAHRVQWGPFVNANLTDATALAAAFATHQPAAVIHCAGHISVPESVANPYLSYHNNTAATLALLQAMHTATCTAIVFSSTAAVYGIPTQSPVPENAPLLPINPYGRSKLMVEHLLADAAPAYALRAIALRYFNAAGATPTHGLGYHRAQPFHLIPMALLATLGHVPPLKLFGTDYPTPDGTAVRDYIHVTDLAHAHVLAIQHLLASPQPGFTALNLGTGSGATVQQVLNACQQATGLPVPHSTAPRRAGDPPSLVAAVTTAQQLFGWSAQHSSLANILATDWAWHQTLPAPTTVV